MVVRRPTGIINPAAEFAEFREWRMRLIHLQDKVRPQGPDYLMLEALKRHLETTADHFTGQRGFLVPTNLGHSA